MRNVDIIEISYLKKKDVFFFFLNILFTITPLIRKQIVTAEKPLFNHQSNLIVVYISLSSKRVAYGAEGAATIRPVSKSMP